MPFGVQVRVKRLLGVRCCLLGTVMRRGGRRGRSRVSVRVRVRVRVKARYGTAVTVKLEMYPGVRIGLGVKVAPRRP